MTIEKRFTSSKTSEYAIFYNIAYWWINDLLRKLYNSEEHSSDLDHAESIDRFIENNDISDYAYLKLRDYLWKGYKFDKNKSGESLSSDDKVLIYGMIKKLKEVRNFHSHYWHDDINLVFEKQIADWIEELHQYAIDNLQKEHSRDVEQYLLKNKPLFNEHGGKCYISPDGRNFFLSFFLKSSEMTRFLQHRKYCRRNDKPEFRIKHLVCKYFTHRDGASNKRYNVKNDDLSSIDDKTREEVLKARQLYRMLTYLNDVPSEIIDRKMFPIMFNNKPVVSARQFNDYISTFNLFEKCSFYVPLNKLGEEYYKIIGFEYGGFEFQISVNTLHKLILDVSRDSSRIESFYKTLDTFANFRCEFPEDLDAFSHDSSYVDLMNEYYTFKLKTNDKIRGLLAKIIDSQKASYSDKKSLLDLLEECPIKLSYSNFYFEANQKQRSPSQFMRFSVEYLISNNIVPQWEWLIEKFENEEVCISIGGTNDKDSKSVVKQVKKYSSHIEDGYRINLKKDMLILRLKDKPQFVFSVGETTMRNIMVALLIDKKKNISNILNLLYSDLNTIKQAAMNKKAPSEELKLLNTKTMPRYLKVMMRDKDAVDKESLSCARSKGKDRLTSIIDKFESLLINNTLTRKEVNTQLISCYKLYDWNYPKQSEYKFLRQNEYQQMSIYHYSLAKDDLTKRDIEKLSDRLLGDINLHMPDEIKNIINKSKSLDDLFCSILEDCVKKLKKWKNKLSSTETGILEQRLRKINVHFPVFPIPDAANNSNIVQMKHLPLMIHPALVFKALDYDMDPKRFVRIRSNVSNKQGLDMSNYNIDSYITLSKNANTDVDKLQHRLVGNIDNLITKDILILAMLKGYLKDTDSHIAEAIKNTIKGSNSDKLDLLELNDTELEIFKSVDKTPKFKVIAKYKQLNDYMIIDGNHLMNLAKLVLNKYSDDYENNNIMMKDKYWEIPFVLIKQMMDEVNQQSLMVVDFIFDFEKDIIDNLDDMERSCLIEETCLNTDLSEHIDFPTICNHSSFNKEEKSKLRYLRNTAMHMKIPNDKSFMDMLEEDRIKEMLHITDEKLKQYEKKDAFYEARALLSIL